MPRKRKDQPVPLEEVRFSGDANLILASLKRELAERDRYINVLENENLGLEKCANRVWAALEEAEAMANRFPQFVQDALNDPKKHASRLAEAARYGRIFREAKDDFQRLR